MSDLDDTDGMLHRFVTDDYAERLLAGGADAGDDELAAVAGLFAALRAPSQASELAGTDDLVARMAVAVRNGETTSARPPQRRRALAQLITAKVAVLAVVAFVSAGAAAAATGNLPDPLQRTVSKTFSHVGVDLPSPSDKPTTSTAPANTSAATSGASASANQPTTAPDTASNAAVGPDALGPAKTGLCAAFLNGHEKNLDAVAFKNLTVTASAAGQTVEKFCAPAADITTPTSPTTTTPTSVEGGKPTNPGQQGSTPAATAPGRTSDPGNSGSTPAPTAPGKSPDPGSSGSTPAATAPRTNPSPTSARGRP